jgi:hypothetical protein
MRLRRSVLAAAAISAFALSACTTTMTVRVGDDPWTVTCSNVAPTDCEGIVRMFLNNLAWSYGWVHDESGATIQVSVSTMCPTFSALAQPGACWRANAPVRSSRACMIMARRIRPEQGYDFVRIGGDELTGNMTAPKPGTTPC